MDGTINTISQLGGTVFTVVAFLYYLTKNSEQQTAAQIQLAVALENLANKIESGLSATRNNTNAINTNTDSRQS